jgi:putative copper export protein
MEETPVYFSDYRHMLLHTIYGNAWVAYVILLTTGVLLIRRPWPAWLCGLGAGLALAVCGHSGEYGLDEPLYWLGAMHLLLALTWIGGLSVLVMARLAGGWQADFPALQYFSRVALPVFILIMLTGLARLGLQYVYEQGLGAIYLIMLGCKLVAVAGVVASAAGLRALLKAQPFSERRYDNGLGPEVFFAALLIIATALLTQLPPR